MKFVLSVPEIFHRILCVRRALKDAIVPALQLRGGYCNRIQLITKICLC